MSHGQEFIPLSTPLLDGREKEYLADCVNSGWVATGKYVQGFENAVSGYIGANGAVAVSNGTAALHIALKLLDIGPGDAVICPSLTFVASTNAITYTGARPIFLDSNQDNWGLDPKALEQYLDFKCDFNGDGPPTERQYGLKIRAVMVVHLYGHPADMGPILETASHFGVPIVEDASESLGSKYQEAFTGVLGQIGCLSFNGNKTLTSGGGGMLVSPDADLLDRARLLTNQAKDAGDEFFHSEVGYNYRLSNLHAAVGLAQFEQLDGFISSRRRINEQYSHALSEVPGVSMLREQPWAYSNCWLTTVLLDPNVIAIPTATVVARMRESGIEVRRPFVPNHMLPPYKNDLTFGELPVAGKLYNQGLNLPSSAWMNEGDVERVIDTLTRLTSGSNSLE